MSTQTKSKTVKKNAPGPKGKIRVLPVDSLIVDRSYQRSAESESTTSKMANNFNWVAFGTPTVMERPGKGGSKFYVVDGQHRVIAAKNYGLTSVRCLVFKSNGKKHEARGFLDTNINRKNVSSIDKFRAGVLAEIEPYTEINNWLKSMDLTVSASVKTPKTIQFPHHLVRTWKQGPESCKQALMIQLMINGDVDTLTSDCHEGLFWLIYNDVPVAAYVEKLKKLGGRSAMSRSITAMAIEMGTQVSARVAGLGILRLINHRLRNKVHVVV